VLEEPRSGTGESHSVDSSGKGGRSGSTRRSEAVSLSADDGEARILVNLKRLVQLSGVAEFEYQKKDGQTRSVRVAPTDLKRTPKGPLIVGYDLDRNGERNFYVSGIQ